jgi:MoxR-like ATPase
MAWPEQTITTIRRLDTIQRELGDRYVDRDKAIRLLVLATVCQEHLLLIGPPGTAKTGLVDQFCRSVGAQQFRYLLTRFTEPSELFGPLDIEQFQAGTYRIKTENMLPEAEIAFLDEVFQGSSAILNTLLTLLNERRFDNGAEGKKDVPLISLYGATAVPPEDPALLPFSDRFLLRLELARVGDNRLADLLEVGWEGERAILAHDAARPVPPVAPSELRDLTAQVRHVELKPVFPVYQQLIRELRAQGVMLSDRRVVRGLKLVAAACMLREADIASAVDLWPLEHFWTDPEDADLIQQAIAERIADDPGAPSRPGRVPAEILADARFEVDQLNSGRFAITDGLITATLQILGRLHRELRAGHPAATQERADIDRLIEEVEALYP